MNSPAEMIIQLGRTLEKQHNAAFDMWTWLPSYRQAVAGHGDYASVEMPPIEDIITEATIFIRDGAPKEITPMMYRNSGGLYKCPCGEDHLNLEGRE